MSPSPPPPQPDPAGVLDAIAVCTAAIAGDNGGAEVLLRHALMGPDADEVLCALTTTIAMIGEETREHGLDLGVLLADLGLGVQLLALQGDEAAPAPPQPPRRGR